MSVLNNIDQVRVQGELFLPRKRVAARRWDSDFARPRFIETYPQARVPWRPRAVFAYLDRFYDGEETTGFKLMYSQVRRYPETIAYFRLHGIRIVHLVRLNHLDVVISNVLKRKIGQAHVLAGQAQPQDVRIRLETDKLVKQLAWLERKQVFARRLLRWSGLSHIEVAYENLVQDASEFDRIWDFLSINAERSAPQSQLVRIRTKSYADTIINFEEVRQVVTASRFAHLLTELPLPTDERKPPFPTGLEAEGNGENGKSAQVHV
jgi:hypothetical protein